MSWPLPGVSRSVPPEMPSQTLLSSSLRTVPGWEVVPHSATLPSILIGGEGYVRGIPSPPPHTQAARDTDGSRRREEKTTTASRTRPASK